MPHVIDDDLKARLLASIASDSLIMLCGAGLSMASPSSISSAWKVAQHCAAEYRARTGVDLPNGLADNIELMAEHFFGRNELEHVLLKQLIDWSEFVRSPPNQGHFAVADFLASRVCSLVLSTNLDTMIESAATSLGEPDFFPIVVENDLNLHQLHAPLLKIHGCANRTRHESLWCKQQLQRAPLKKRIPTLVRWMQGHVPNRDLLIVGFWTDWSYLNKVLEDAVVSTEPRSIILVDPSSAEDLEAKSPKIWTWAQKRTTFIHVQASGDTFLNELRWRVSSHHIWQAWQKGRAIYKDLTGSEAPTDPVTLLASLSTDELYQLRRDLTGVTSASVVRQKCADASEALLGAIQLALAATGAALRSHLFDWNGATVRLINTPNRPLSAVRKEFSTEPPDPMPAQRTVCVGAIDDGGVPANIIGRGTPHTFIRNVTTPTWETHATLFSELGIGGQP
jgi:hypothetical protein